MTMFNKVSIIGFGLIGSSLARAMKAHNLARQIICIDHDEAVCAKALELNIANAATISIAEGVQECFVKIYRTKLNIGGIMKILLSGHSAGFSKELLLSGLFLMVFTLGNNMAAYAAELLPKPVTDPWEPPSIGKNFNVSGEPYSTGTKLTNHKKSPRRTVEEPTKELGIKIMTINPEKPWSPSLWDMHRGGSYFIVEGEVYFVPRLFPNHSEPLQPIFLPEIHWRVDSREK